MKASREDSAMRQRVLARMSRIARDFSETDPIRKVHVIIAVDRFLARLLSVTAWGEWAIKGGYAVQLRAPYDARFTDDADIRIQSPIERAYSLVENAVFRDLEDGFVYELSSSPKRLDGPPGGGMRFPMSAQLFGVELVSFKVDVSSGDALTQQPDVVWSDPRVEASGFEPSRFPVYPLVTHFAEKIHAYTLPRSAGNTRVKDLADLVWLIEREHLPAEDLLTACQATFTRRGAHAWPPGLSRTPRDWGTQYAKLRGEMRLGPRTAQEASDYLELFLREIGARGSSPR